MKVLKPGAIIGILGGGQLGRMIVIAGRNMGYRFIVLDPTPDSPCGQVADRQIKASFSDLEAARELARGADVVTYEFENVDAEVAAELEQTAYVPQGSELLKTTQNRIREKTTIESHGVPVAPFRQIHTEEDLKQAVRDLGLPCVLKTATGGYDGKGQWVIREQKQISDVFQESTKARSELVVEKFISFQKELSVIVARNAHGEVKVFPASENIHINNILHMSIVPARITAEQKQQAEKAAVAIAHALNAVGLIAIEMFLDQEGRILVNELAPRPHNSGHYTMDACSTSQFEQHIRAICGLPLGDCSLLTPVVMVNILGQHLEAVLEHLELLPSTAKLHLYGKAESKVNRKMGHINFLAPTVEEALSQIEKLPIWNR